MQISPVSTKKTYQYIVEQIIQLIKDDQLNTGEKLPSERTLAEMFKVSRASIREAFRAMEIVGIIQVRPGEGTFVTNLNIAPFINTISPLFVKNESMKKELLEFRKMIEIEAVKLAAQKISNEKLLEFENIMGLMNKAYKESNSSLEVEADIAFHKTIFSATDNFILIKAGECIWYIIESSVKFNREKVLSDRKVSELFYQHHTKIFEAIKNKDADRAMEMIEKHLSSVQEMF